VPVDPPRPGSPAGRSPERVGRYELLTELCSSALGSLWAARVASGIEEGRLVSVRRIALRGGDAQRLTTAGVTAMRVRDPKIVAVLDVAQVDRELLVASEYVDGESLRTVLRAAFSANAPIPAPVALRIAADTLRAARAAVRHWKTLTADADPALAAAVSGGLSPDSVMIAGFGDSLLADAGIAGTLASLPSLRQRPDWVCYRAPEQLAAGFEPVDERSDVFSIGVLLWEMLANRPLFRTSARSQGPAEASAVAERVLKAHVERLDHVTRAGAPIPAAAVELVARAVERDRGARFESLDAMLTALKALPARDLATPEQVVVVLNQLAQSAIQTRHAAIERAFGRAKASESQPPESGRSTLRPVAPAPEDALASAVGPGVLAPLKLDGLDEALQQFSEHEAPTRSRAAVLPKAPEPFADEAPTRTRPGAPPKAFGDEAPTKPRRPPGAAFAPLNPLLPLAPARASEAAPEPPPTPDANASFARPLTPPQPFAAADVLETAFSQRPARGSMPDIEFGAPVPITSTPPPPDAPAPSAVPPGPALPSFPAPGAPAAPLGNAAPFLAAAPLAMPGALPPGVTSDSQSGVEASFRASAGAARQARARAITIGVLVLVALVGIIAVVRGLSHRSKRAAARSSEVAKSAGAATLPTTSVASAADTGAPSAAPEANGSPAEPSAGSTASAPPAAPANKKGRGRHSGTLRWPPPKNEAFKPKGI
jgi:eukaryotic-like serine/threonine-protein kinase